MRTHATRTMLMLGMFAATAAPAAAQPWERGRDPRDGACVYKDADFRGPRLCVNAGESIDSLPWHLNDEISSIRTFGRVEVVVFRDPDFRGNSTRFDTDVRDLQWERWNDRVSSLRVRGLGWTDRRNDRRDRWDDRREERRDDRDDRRDERRDDRRDDRRVDASEADRMVRAAYREVFSREVDAEGLRIYRNRILEDGWSQQDVRDALRDSPEYREKTTMTWAKAQEVVRQAYLTVLRREPDAGSRGYVDRVMRDHWTQADVERELRRSPEARDRR